MNKIQEVKERADILRVAQYFNINLNRTGKGLCPFHKEDTASFSISTSKQIWKCFGCNRSGDVISLVQELLNINAYEASKQVNDICNCGVDFNTKANKLDIEKYQQKQKIKQDFNNWIDDAYDILTDYFKLLTSYTDIKEIDDKKAIEACQNISKVEALIDMLFRATEDERVWFWKNYRKEVEDIGTRLKREVA